MSTTERPALPQEGRITRWSLGSSDPWATLDVDLGAITATVAMSSREAREFALAVLADQGPYLGYQPPNPSMREHPAAGIFGSRESGGKPGWRKRQDIEFAVGRLQDLREQFGDEAFGWALQRLEGP